MEPFNLTQSAGRIHCFALRAVGVSVLAIFCMMGGLEVAQSATNPVTTLADGGPGSLRQTIADAAPGDAIVFSVSGTIVLTNGQLLVAKDVNIVGPSVSAMAVSGNNANRIFYIPANVIATISDLTICNGRTPLSVDNSFQKAGSAIFNEGTLRLNRCVISSNNAGGGANGLRGYVGSPGGGGGGGAIYNRGIMELYRCTACFNYSGAGGSGGEGDTTGGSGGDGGDGGGIFNHGFLSLVESTISSNYCGSGGAGGPGYHSGGRGGRGGAGGGIYSSGTLTMNGCTLLGNKSADGGPGGFGSGNQYGYGGEGGDGGGIFALGILTVTNCTVVSNYCGSGNYGGYYQHPLYYGCGAGGDGGGISSDATNQAIVSSTIVANVAGPGRLMYPPNLFYGVGNGGGVHRSTTVSNCLLLNTLVALNTGPAPDVLGIFDSLGHNLIRITNGSTGFIAPSDLTGSSTWPIEPKVGRLADNGGPTLTMSLLRGSRAIDAGVTVGSRATDQRGVARPQGLAADIGAFEYQPVPFVSTVRIQNMTNCLLQMVDFPPNQSFTLMASPDLVTWAVVANLTADTNGFSQFVEHMPVDCKTRFYRTRLSPP